MRLIRLSNIPTSDYSFIIISNSFCNIATSINNIKYSLSSTTNSFSNACITKSLINVTKLWNK